MTNLPDDNSFSLLDQRATGGDYASQGFTFQEAVFLIHIADWLIYSPFTACLREGLDDLEAKFFAAEGIFRKERIQVKHEVLSVRDFWSIIFRFKEIYEANPSSYAWFTIACIDIAPSLQSALNGLRRFRDPYPFYFDDEIIVNHSYRAFVERVQQLGINEETALFLFHHVRIEKYESDLEHTVQARFKGCLTENFPLLKQLSDQTLDVIYQETKNLIASRRNLAIERSEFITILNTFSPTISRGDWDSICFETIGIQASQDSFQKLKFDWRIFWGGQEHNYPDAADWNSVLVSQLVTTQNWINVHHLPRRIVVEGERRLTSALAIGSVFSAVGNFSLEINHRGVLYETTNHATPDTPEYPVDVNFTVNSSPLLVVAIDAAMGNISNDVEEFITNAFDEAPSVLYLKSIQPILSGQHNNRAVSVLKNYIRDAVHQTGAQEIHLFIASHAPLALFLGHRLNTLPPIQCYEWLGKGRYTPTCYLS